jgi:hypothetical protein
MWLVISITRKDSGFRIQGTGYGKWDTGNGKWDMGYGIRERMS